MTDHETPGRRLYRVQIATGGVVDAWDRLGPAYRKLYEDEAAAFLGPGSVAVRADDLRAVLGMADELHTMSGADIAEMDCIGRLRAALAGEAGR